MTVGTTTHLSLGGHEYIIKPFSYSKRAAPQFGARFATGDPDYNNFSFWQHWAQKCFIGGMDQEEFSDDAMYYQGVGVNTMEHDKVTLARDLRRGAGTNWAVSAGDAHGNNGSRFIIYNNKLYWLGFAALTNTSYLWEYAQSSESWTRITALDGRNICARCVATFDGKLYIGGVDATTGTGKLVYSSGSLGTWTTVTNPSGVTSAVRSMRAFQRKLYVAYMTQIWRQKEDQTWDGNTVFYKADMNSDSNYIVAMETHLGFLYLLSQNGHIHRTDGNSTFDIWSWDGQTSAVSMRSFDGRLFISTAEYLDPSSPTSCQGVLYQLTGSAVTELKRWGKSGYYIPGAPLIAYGRRLFYGASSLLGISPGFGIGVYDPVEDAHSIFASNQDTTTYPAGGTPYYNHAVDDVIVYGPYMFAAKRASGVFFTRFSFQDRIRIEADYDITKAGAQPGPQNGGWFTTSTYDAGTPGTYKLWRKVGVDYELPHSSTSILVEYSTTNGASWTAFTTLTTGSSTTRTRSYLHMNVKSTSIKLRFTLRSTNSIYTPIMYGFVMSYLPMLEPNWLWTFTIVLSEKQQALDGTTLTVDTEAEMAFLSNLFRSKALTTFVDIDGVSWESAGGPGVLIYDIDFRVPHQTQPLEGEVVVTLLEAVELY